ncbi:MAG: hypothetical protein LBG17_05935 [Bacteroidales bacterium]|jgi:hypothetical protein|nr:hypothetical protein [Bacteroidales bacterium]
MKNVVDIMNTQMPRIINIGKKWANGKTGTFYAFDDYTLRFRALNSDLERYVEGDNWVEHAPIIACGFMVYLLYSTRNSRNYKMSDIYANYYQCLCNAYKEIEDKKPDAFKRDLDKEFYEKHILDEQEKVRLSKGIFDFLTNEDKDTINEYINCYFGYIKRFAAKWATNEMDKSFEELWAMAKKYDLIQTPHYIDNQEINMMTHENILRFNFSVWLQQEYKDGIEEQYTFDNFKRYLKDRNTETALAEKRFEKEKLKHQNDVAPELNSDANKTNTEKLQQTVDIEKMKEYLIPNIFTKKGKQKSNADELIKIIQADRNQAEIAAIAKYIQENHLLKDKYKHSLDWTKWLKIFYEISGLKKAYPYRLTKVTNDTLEAQLNALFPKPKNNK